jgi:hypothetical protein
LDIQAIATEIQTQKKRSSKSRGYNLAGYALSRAAFENLAPSLNPSAIVPLLGQKHRLRKSKSVFISAVFRIVRR